jgi:hypothetical protein
VPTALFIAATFVAPLFIFAPLLTNTPLFVAGMCLTSLAGAAWGVLPLIGFQIFAPKRMAGRLAALELFLANLVGYGLGPVLTVCFGNLWTGGNEFAGIEITKSSLARGLTINGLIAAPIMIIGSYICMKTAKRLPVVES